eukprot:scaffold1028_cov106-Alexandrium_tamarense.AAC.1
MHPSMSSFMRNTNGDTDTAADPAAVGESGNEPDASHHNTAAESVAWSTEDDAKLMNAYRKANTINISSDGSTQIDYDDYKTWDAISQQMTPARTSVQCLLRYLKLNSKNIPNKKRKLDDTVTIEESAQKEVPAEETTGISTNLIRPSLWTEGETAQLKELMESYKGSCWQSISVPDQVKGRGSWTTEEDTILVEKRGALGKKWSKIAYYLPGRTGKQCRERYVNHLDPELKAGEWNDDEEAILIAMHKHLGNKWT